MAEKDKFADEMLTDDELDQVAGGDYSEYERIINFITLSDDIGYNGSIYDMDYLKSFLHDKFGIDAEIYTDSRENKYTDVETGKSLSYVEAIMKMNSICPNPFYGHW